MFGLLVVILLLILVISVWRRGPYHQAAVARRAARKQEFREQTAAENRRLHTVYNRAAIREGNERYGRREAARRRRAEFKGHDINRV